MPDRLVMSSHAQTTDVIARAVAAAALALPPRLDANRMADNRIPENSHAG
jgi:hypothetical protein